MYILTEGKINNRCLYQIEQSSIKALVTMKEEKDKRIEDILSSMQGSQRAQPDLELFAKIEQRIDAPEAKIIPMRQWSYAVAAAIVLLILNTVALRQFTQSDYSNTPEMVVTQNDSRSLISNYRIYEWWRNYNFTK